MYRIAVCEDDPRTAEQNKAATCHALDGRGRIRGQDYDVDGGSFMAGQVAGMVHEIRPLRQIFEELMAGYAAVRKGLSE